MKNTQFFEPLEQTIKNQYFTTHTMNKNTLHKEGKATFYAGTGKITADMPVFYNPIMKLNRDISIAITKQYNIKEGADILAGSGIRSIRLLLEGGLEHIHSNDASSTAIKAIQKNAKINKITKKITITQQSATKFLEENKGFEYIDIDPFGTPNPFLDGATKKIHNHGILAVTATDTAPLAGTYPYACKRKYWAVPLRNHLKHEVAVRILIRKIQLVGAQYDKALTPIYAHSTQHYYRVYLRCEKGKMRVDEIIKQHHTCIYDQDKEELVVSSPKSQVSSFRSQVSDLASQVQNSTSLVGPLWTGTLWNEEIARAVAKEVPENMTRIIAEESTIHTLGYYDIHELASKHKIQIPKFETIIQRLKEKGYQATRTHFTPTGIRTNATYKEMMKSLGM